MDALSYACSIAESTTKDPNTDESVDGDNDDIKEDEIIGSEEICKSIINNIVEGVLHEQEAEGDEESSDDEDDGEEEEVGEDGVKKKKAKKSDSRRYVCYWCDKRFSKQSHLKQHIPSHMKESRIPCTLCDKTFSQKSALTEHLRIHTGERPYACGVCGKGFASSSKLGKHLQTHSEVKRHACDTCDKTFSEVALLKTHTKKCGVDERSVKVKGKKKMKILECKKCQAGFTRRDDLNMHRREIHHEVIIPKGAKNKPTEDGDYQCPRCEKRFRKSNYLNRHLRRHEGLNRHKCETCGKEYTNKYGLLHHMARFHGTAPKNFECPVCHESFAVQLILRRHMKSHQIERPFQCDECPGTYKSKDDLRRHKRTHRERPYKCEVCGSGFVDTTGLIRHSRTHTGEKPFRCPECDQCFSQSSSMKQHRLKKHPHAQQQVVPKATHHIPPAEDLTNAAAVNGILNWISQQSDIYG